MEVEVTVRVAASPEYVWQVISDVERWPEWTPTVTHATKVTGTAIRAPLALGSTFHLKQPRLPEAAWRVNAITPGESFTWTSRIRGTSNVATHTVVSDGTGGAKVTLRFVQRGVVAAFAWPMTRKMVRLGVETEAESLRTYCETRAAVAA